MRAMRVFVGIPVAEGAAEKLARTLNHLSLRKEDLRRPRPKNWHITLQFLGNVSQPQLDCLLPRLAEVSSEAVRLRIVEIGLLGTGVLAAHIEPTPQLLRLLEQVTAATNSCGFPSEQRSWRPHITLARIKGKGRASKRSLERIRTAVENHRTRKPANSDCEFLAREFLLYESFTDSEGARYEVQARFPLRRQDSPAGFSS